MRKQTFVSNNHKNGPGRLSDIADFFVLSKQLLMGYVRLGQVRENDCPAVLEKFEIGEKLA